MLNNLSIKWKIALPVLIVAFIISSLNYVLTSNTIKDQLVKNAEKRHFQLLLLLKGQEIGQPLKMKVMFSFLIAYLLCIKMEI